MIAFRPFLVLFLILAPVQAHARCEGAIMLGTFHDAYRATLTGEGANRRDAAVTLLFIAGGQNSTDFARRIAFSGATISADRLHEALKDAEDLATRTLQNLSVLDRDFRHGRNVQWLGDTFLLTDCQNSPLAASRTPSATSFEAGSPKKPEETEFPWIVAVVALAFALVGYSGYRLHTSFTMRLRRVERQPRTPIKLSLQASYAFPDGQIRTVDVDAVDISLGGMKLSWENAPPVGTAVTLSEPLGEKTCRITWSNSFYAGSMFDEQLSEDELESCKRLGKAASKQKNGAVADAA